MKNIKIGYQGGVGSNSEKAAKLFTEQKAWTGSLLIPCFDSKGVVDALIHKRIDLGVLALNNVIAGEVLETKFALEYLHFELKGSLSLSINHCLCTLNDLTIDQITEIVSHPHALSQISVFLDKNFATIPRSNHQDTALAAIDLAEGKLPKSAAIIATKEAAMANKLQVRFENIANTKENFTNFILIKL